MKKRRPVATSTFVGPRVYVGSVPPELRFERRAATLVSRLKRAAAGEVAEVHLTAIEASAILEALRQWAGQ